MKKSIILFAVAFLMLFRTNAVYADDYNEDISSAHDVISQEQNIEDDAGSSAAADESEPEIIGGSEIITENGESSVGENVPEQGTLTDDAGNVGNGQILTDETDYDNSNEILLDLEDEHDTLYTAVESNYAVSFQVKGVFGGRTVTFNTDAPDGTKIYYSSTTSNLTESDLCVSKGETVLFEDFYGTIYARTYINGVWGNVSRLILKIPVANTPEIAINNDEVTIQTTTPSCYIYYTTDGTEPSITNGTRDSGSKAVFKLNGGAHIKAIAVRSCFTSSGVAELLLPLDPPSFAVKGIFGGRNVTFTTNNPDAEIYYSTTTSALTVNDEHLKSGESIDFSNYYGTLYAKAYVNGRWSNVSRLVLKIPVVNQPTITKSGEAVTIKTTTPNSYICYTTDGTEPSLTNGKRVASSTAVIYPKSGDTIRAIAIRNCFTNSAEQIFRYVYYPTVQNTSGSGSQIRTVSVDTATNRWGTVPYSYIYEDNDKIIVVDANTTSGTVKIDTYDLFTRKLEGTKTITNELSIFGGFFSGEKYNYIMFGQNNSEENNSKEVVRVVKYDKAFNKISSLSVTGGECNTVAPFDSASASFAENGSELTIHTGRKRYTTSDGLNHQSQLTFLIDTDTMQLKEEVKTFQNNHVSHSFNQKALYDNGVQILVDHGDAYPRTIVLNKRVGSYYSDIDLFNIPGSIGANCTGVSLGGFEISENNYLVAINSIDHSKVSAYTSFDMEGLVRDERDVIVLVSAKDNTSTGNVKQIKFTDYVNQNKLASTPYLVKISDNRFAVLWEEIENLADISNTYAVYEGWYSTNAVSNGLKYVIIDGDGNKVSDIKSMTDVHLSADCQPIVSNGNIMWYINSSGGRTFYTIDIS